MKKIFLFVAYGLLITVNSYAQVPADSLKGTYAGIAYSKVLSTDSWTIRPDTLLVSHIDSANCFMGINLCGWQNIPLYSEYTYCNSSVQGNYYARFYSMDSLIIVADSNTIQPPCVSAFSIRFYGKRISSDWGLGMNEIKYKEQLIVYPNPSNTILFVEYNRFNGVIPIRITDVTGQEIKNVQMNNAQMQIDISGFKNGIYFVNVKTANGTFTRKIVVQR